MSHCAPAAAPLLRQVRQLASACGAGEPPSAPRSLFRDTAAKPHRRVQVYCVSFKFCSGIREDRALHRANDPQYINFPAYLGAIASRGWRSATPLFAVSNPARAFSLHRSWAHPRPRRRERLWRRKCCCSTLRATRSNDRPRRQSQRTMRPARWRGRSGAPRTCA